MERIPYLQATNLVDYNHPSIRKLVEEREWAQLSDYDTIREIYEFVRNEIPFGYNRSDDIPASEVLRDGCGQCNTKSILLMALLRKAGIPCRIHGFYIDKRMQKGALTGVVYFFAPQKIVHAWTEVYYDNKWLALEEVIIDDPYLSQVKDKLCSSNGGYIGYGIAVKNREQINLCCAGTARIFRAFPLPKIGILRSSG